MAVEGESGPDQAVCIAISPLRGADLAIISPVSALTGEPIPGPIAADVVSVYDGDTLTVDAHPWPQITVRTSVRVSSIDTPEIRGK